MPGVCRVDVYQGLGMTLFPCSLFSFALSLSQTPCCATNVGQGSAFNRPSGGRRFGHGFLLQVTVTLAYSAPSPFAVERKNE